MGFECLDPNDIFFVDFFQKSLELEKRVYSFCNELPKVEQAVYEIMKQEPNIKLILFRDALVHVVRTTRVLRFQRGYLLLVGQAGSGKRSIAQLSALASNCVFYTLKQFKNYSYKDYLNDFYELVKVML